MKRAFLIAATVLLVAPTTASAWSDSIRVGSTVREWTSPQSFAKDDQIRLQVFSGGRELVPSPGVKDCRSYFYGRGLAVWADSCGRHLKLRFANVGREKVLRIRYSRL